MLWRVLFAFECIRYAYSLFNCGFVAVAVVAVVAVVVVAVVAVVVASHRESSVGHFSK